MTRLLRGVLVVMTVAGVSACATTSDDGRDYGFGGAVRNMVERQTYDPAAARNPSTAAAPIDGARAEEVMKNYRKDKSEAEKAPDIFIVR